MSKPPFTRPPKRAVFTWPNLWNRNRRTSWTFLIAGSLMTTALFREIGFPDYVSLVAVFNILAAAFLLWQGAKDLLWGNAFSTIAIDEQGIEFKPSTGSIPWSDVVGINIDKLYQIDIKTKDPRRFPYPGGPMGRWLMRRVTNGIYSIPVKKLNLPPALARAAFKDLAPPGILTSKPLDPRSTLRCVAGRAVVILAIFSPLVVVNLLPDIRVPLHGGPTMAQAQTAPEAESRSPQKALHLIRSQN